MAGLIPAFPSADQTGTLNGQVRPFSPARDAWRRFCRHRLALVSLIILSVTVTAILLGPFVWTAAINDIDFGARLEGPSAAHPLGTDDLGQDLLARMLYGGRISIA